MTYLDNKILKILNEEDEFPFVQQLMASIVHKPLTWAQNVIKTDLIEDLKNSFNFREYLFKNAGFDQYTEMTNFVVKAYSDEARNAIERASHGDHRGFDELFELLNKDVRVSKYLKEYNDVLEKSSNNLSKISKFWNDVILAHPGKSGLVLIAFMIISGLFYKKFKKWGLINDIFERTNYKNYK